jgi:hypothetical protein
MARRTPERLESGERASEVVDVVHEPAFGHLQALVGRTHPGASQDVLDHTGDVRVSIWRTERFTATDIDSSVRCHSGNEERGA